MKRSTPGRRPMHEGLVGQRELVGQPYLRDPELRREYQAEIAPRTEIALAKVLAEAFRDPPAKPPRVLDLGAGTGAAGTAIRAFFGASTELVSVDRVTGPGIVLADIGAPGPLRGVDGRFDVIVAAHLLNELYLAMPPVERISARVQRVRAWCESLLAPGGTIVILEPALRETSRELLAMRDQLVAGGLHVVAPCLWAGPCPALARDRDWCHDTTFEPAEVVGQRPRRVDFSYLALRATGEPSSDPSLFRVVSDLLEEKGRLRVFGCGPSGRHPLVRLDRHRTPANAAFDSVARGDLIRVEGATAAGDGQRIGPDSIVERSLSQGLPSP